MPDLFSVIRITPAASIMEPSITKKQKSRIGFSVVRVLEQDPYNAVACEINMMPIVNNPVILSALSYDGVNNAQKATSK